MTMRSLCRTLRALRALLLVPTIAIAFDPAAVARARAGRISLGGTDLSYADFRSASFSGADFRGADLRGVNFRGADLTYANFTHANLTYVRLSNTFHGEIPDSRFGLRDGVRCLTPAT
jgi:uncharacterized protein YjbI with pentapeptide repeats